jgi:hypothetical protein
MKQKIIAGLIGLSLGTASLADAYLTGQQLHEDCGSPKASYEFGICLGFIRGVGESSKGLCLPANKTDVQQIITVVEYLNVHPESWQRPAVLLVEQALVQGFPCSTGK